MLIFITGYIVSLLMLIFVSFFEIWWPDTFPEHVSYKITLFSVSVVAFGCTGELLQEKYMEIFDFTSDLNIEFLYFSNDFVC